MSFIGEYEITLDAKGRFSVPVNFRKQLAEGEEANGFVVSRGNGKFLNFYTKAEWALFSSKLNKLSDFNPKASMYKRLVGVGTELQLDSAGRVLLPKHLQVHAGMSKEVFFICVGNKIELWDKANYINTIAEQSAQIEDLSIDLFGDSAMDPFGDIS